MCRSFTKKMFQEQTDESGENSREGEEAGQSVIAGNSPVEGRLQLFPAGILDCKLGN